MRRTIALACLLMLLATACAQTKDTGFPPPPPTTASEDDHGGEEGEEGEISGPIEMGDSFYKPKAGTVAVGTVVTWEQTGTEPHSVTFDDDTFDSSPDCPPVDKCTQLGDEVTYEFTTAGVFAYYCKIHGGKGGIGMAGVVTVE
jgi:plastocyanin